MSEFEMVSELKTIIEHEAMYRGKQVYEVELVQDIYGDYDVVKQHVKAWLMDSEGFSVRAFRIAERTIDLKEFNYSVAHKQGAKLIKELEG